MKKALKTLAGLGSIAGAITAIFNPALGATIIGVSGAISKVPDLIPAKPGK